MTASFLSVAAIRFACLFRQLGYKPRDISS